MIFDLTFLLIKNKKGKASSCQAQIWKKKKKPLCPCFNSRSCNFSISILNLTPCSWSCSWSSSMHSALLSCLVVLFQSCQATDKTGLVSGSLTVTKGVCQMAPGPGIGSGRRKCYEDKVSRQMNTMLGLSHQLLAWQLVFSWSVPRNPRANCFW